MKTMLLTIAAVSIGIPALFTGMHPARHLCPDYSVTSPADDRSERTSRSNADSALSGTRRSFRPPLPADTGVNYEGSIPLTQQNRVENYAIVFSKTGMEDFNLLIDCTFTLRFDEDSTAVMRFGGDAAYSVGALRVTVSPEAAWHYDPEAKTIAFTAPTRQPRRIRMTYVYCNLTSAFVYGDNGCELWEPSYGENFYPYVFGDRSLFDVRYELPAGIVPLGGYPTQECVGKGNTRLFHSRIPETVVSHSCVFALLDTTRYRETVHLLDRDTLRLWFMPAPEVPAARIDELHRLTRDATAFFAACFGPYDDTRNAIGGHPVYLFHTSGYSNRNNLNLISASQEKFAAKPHLLPLAHEIGHRWLGEWTLLIPDGAEAAYFIKESLNEYMTLLFVRATAGEEVFRSLLETEYEKPMQTVRGTVADARLIDMRHNDNNTAVYCKGPVVLDRVASRMGYDRWIGFMRRFYATWRYRPGLAYPSFVGLLARDDPQAARLLDSLVRTF